MTKRDDEPAADALDDSMLALGQQLCFAVYSAAHAFNRTYKPMLDALGITYPQYLVLSVLWEKDGRTIGAIADRLALEPSTITPLVKRLEQAGFVTRLRSTVDERLVGVHLTDKGRGLQAQTGCLTDTLLKRSGMRVEEIIDLNARIQKLREALTAPAET